jgi:aromatic ring-cleaving dioxygenase
MNITADDAYKYAKKAFGNNRVLNWITLLHCTFEIHEIHPFSESRNADHTSPTS